MPSSHGLERQPQVAPLNDEARQSLAHVLQNNAERKRLQIRQKNAALTLQKVAGVVNDRAYDARRRHDNKLQRLEANEEEEPEEELAEYDQYQAQVRDVTKKLDLSIRGIIDDINWLENIPLALKEIVVKYGAVAEETQRTQSTIPMTTQRSRRTIDDEDEDVVMEEAENGESASTEPNPSDTPTALLQKAFEKQASSWNGMTLTERYAQTNEYIGFYRTIHDSNNQGDHGDRAVPVPHHTTWFAIEEGRQTEATSGSDIDEDVQIGRVVPRTICPITLQLFKDPITSKKCPHSFERSAFYEMLKTSSKYLPFTPEQLLELGNIGNRAEKTKKQKEFTIPAVDCPECGKLLAEDDVERNPLLQRVAQRLLVEQRKDLEAQQDSEEDDDELPRGTHRKPIGLGSSPASRRTSGRQAVKNEKGRVVQSPLSSGMQTITTAERLNVVDLSGNDGDQDMSED